MNYRERGNIKWQPFLMPEHRGMLQELYREQYHVDMPAFDDDYLNELDYKIQKYMFKNVPVRIRYFRSHQFIQIRGLILKLHPASRTLAFHEELLWRQRIELDSIVAIDPLDQIDV
ncbi:hypothetical protein AV654_19615 [Paenibacillus elgii]|uniref:YolD-like family protein n=1 Tax=Paenibacillus elgii TaxID=189691 RepID=A0A163XNM2_9BACL|nr:YolD-like family protein [Paenibacillus elgii]KZE78186.1 hypothetical protein AV654_19615 [Paenibacillus elgii]